MEAGNSPIEENHFGILDGTCVCAPERSLSSRQPYLLTSDTLTCLVNWQLLLSPPQLWHYLVQHNAIATIGGTSLSPKAIFLLSITIQVIPIDQCLNTLVTLPIYSDSCIFTKHWRNQTYYLLDKDK